MLLLPAFMWPTVILAAVLIADAALSLSPPRFIRECLVGVNFPRDWWWTLIAVKVVASTGLIVGFVVPGVGLGANAGVVAYFLAAAYAHIRANFLKQEFWVNCLGMLLLSSASLFVSYFRY